MFDFVILFQKQFAPMSSFSSPCSNLTSSGTCVWPNVYVNQITSAGMIPVETAGRQLDDDSWDRKEPASLKMSETYSDAPTTSSV